jgi:hypothetical protein
MFDYLRYDCGFTCTSFTLQCKPFLWFTFTNKFDYFFIPSNNKTFINTESTLSWAAKSVKHFIDNVDKNKDAIRELVSHNFNHFINQTEQEIKGLKSKLPYLDIDDDELTGKL